MKYNKVIRSYTEKYKKKINPDYWFNYKFIKKTIKNIKLKYQNIINNSNINEECCICLENDNVMITFCCHNPIHHKCLVRTFAFSTILCPLCRTNIVDAIKFDPNNEKQKFDAEVMGLISNIHLGIMHIENICNKKLITNSKLLKIYKQINYIAIIKICKKINKYLHIDLKQYFLDFIHNNRIIVP